MTPRVARWKVDAEMQSTAPVQQIQVGLSDAAYTIFIGDFNPDALQGMERGVCAIITNPRVGKLYARRVAAFLRANGYTPRVIEIPDGEKYKTLDTARAVYDRLIDARLDRRSTIFALGGGVVGDLAGLVAATFLRGVPFVQIPTTLLAMVDASIGGKVAANLPRGKNLIGAFKQPRAVIIDPNTLATLPDTEWRAGMAEVIKHGIIGDVGPFEMLERGNWKSEIGSWIGRAIKVKVEIVTRDPFEQGERLKLNLGHTFAHALEKLSNYRLRHGEAVAIGLICAARLAARLELSVPALTARIENLLRATGLPTHVPRDISAPALYAAMTTDKKRAGARIRFVLPRTLGDVVITDAASRADVLTAIKETRE
ncbi:MAG: 3-dehydroquinate synthase [Anaerolineales bacterium]|nr:3-dehydroquinate synthase [Anaerolineales bacterium]